MVCTPPFLRHFLYWFVICTACALFFWAAEGKAAPLSIWDFENGVQGWTGIDASVSTVAADREGGQQALAVTMNDNTFYDGAEVDITSLISALTTAFQSQDFVEVSAWVRIPESSEKNCIIQIGLRTTNGKFTYLDRLRTSETGGIQREDGWVRMRCVLPSFRNSWSEYEHDMQSGALYTPTTLKLLVRAQNIGDSFLLDDIQFRKMSPGEYNSYTPPSESAPDDFLRPCPKGYRLLDGNGDDLILNGINLWLYSDTLNDPLTSLWNDYLYCFDKADLIRIRQEYGMNVIRLNLDYRWFEKSYDTATQTSVSTNAGFAWLDEVIVWAKEAGLYLILDLHSPPGGYQGPGGATASYFSDANLRKRTENLWVAIAERYKHEPQIAAFDLINEPRPANNAQWYAEAQSLITAIRQRTENSNHLILVESPFPTDGNGSTVIRLNDPAGRILYDTHYYSPSDFAFNNNVTSSYSSNNTNLTDGIFGERSFVESENWDDTVVAGFLPIPYGLSKNTLVGFYAGALGEYERSEGLKNSIVSGAAPVNVGEFGVYSAVFARAPVDAVAYLHDLEQVMDFYQIGRQYFCYHGGPLGLHSSFTSFLPVPRLRNEVLHNFFVERKTARAAVSKPEDRDADGLPDIWEEKYLGGMSQAGLQDSDLDDFSNFSEYLAGTLPANATSRFSIAEVISENDEVRISWDAIPGRRYTIEQTDSLATANFLPVAVRSTNRKIRDSVLLPANLTQRFWRVKVEVP